MFATQSPEALNAVSQIQYQFIRLPEVMQMTGYGRSSVLNRVKDGTMPQPIKLGPRATAWIKSEVQAWVDQRIAASRGGVQQ